MKDKIKDKKTYRDCWKSLSKRNDKKGLPIYHPLIEVPYPLLPPVTIQTVRGKKRCNNR